MQQLDRCRIRPVSVLKKHEHRSLVGQLRKSAQERGKCSALPLLWAQLQRRVSVIGCDRQQSREETHVFGQRFSRCQHLLQLPEPVLDAIAAHATGLSFHSGRDWIERALFMIWRAEIVETYMLFVDEPFFQRREQARLSNSRFAGEKHHPPFTRARLSPPVKE